MHTLKCQYGDREIVIIHNGDWAGTCHFKVFPYDAADPFRSGMEKPLVEFDIDGYHVLHMALAIVGPKLMTAAETFIDNFFSTERRRLGRPNLFDLLTRP